MIGRPAKYVSRFLIVVGLSTLLFGAANVVALAFINAGVNSGPQDDILSYSLSPLETQGRATLLAAFGERATARLVASYDYALMPRLIAHPVLPWVSQRTRNEHYTVGNEGIRYLAGWSDADVTELLRSTRRKIFLMGGSTMFGHGVDDDETIAAYLQRQLGARYAVFNFGTSAYDQTLETYRLSYHLRQGLRPNVVILLDGLNDASAIARSNYRVGDKLKDLDFIAGRGTPVPSGYMNMLVQTLPVVRVFRRLTSPHLNAIPVVVDPFESTMDQDEARLVFDNWALFGDTHREVLKSQAVERYGKNLQFLAGVAEAFDFRLLVFYQPNGTLDSSNPMRGDVPSRTQGFRYMTEVQEAVRAAIGEGTIPMIDITGALGALSAAQRAYIDAEHYSPAGNEELARIFSRHITGLYNTVLSRKAN